MRATLVGSRIATVLAVVMGTGGLSFAQSAQVRDVQSLRDRGSIKVAKEHTFRSDRGGSVAAVAADPTLTLNVIDPKICYKMDDILCVTVDQSGLVDPSVPLTIESDSAQIFVDYDATCLEFLGAAPGNHTGGTDASLCPGDADSTFNFEILQDPNIGCAIPGEPDLPGKDCLGYAVGVFLGGNGTSADETIATFQFRVTCDKWSGLNINWDPRLPPTRAEPPLVNRLAHDGNAVLPLNLDDANTTAFACVDGNPPRWKDEDLSCNIPCDLLSVCEDPFSQAYADFCPCKVAKFNDDNLCPDPLLIWNEDDDSGLIGCDRTGLLLRTWFAEDSCGNQTSVVQEIAVKEGAPPSFNHQPGALDCKISCEQAEACLLDETMCGACEQPTAIASCNQVKLTHTDVRTGGDCDGTIIRTWTATDACFLATDYVQEIRINDHKFPVFPQGGGCQSSPCEKVTIRCDEWRLCDANPDDPFCVLQKYLPRPFDNCDDDLDLSYSDNISGLTLCNGTGEVVRTWTACDDCGNCTPWKQTINVKDDVPPTFKHPPNDLDVTIECDQVDLCNDPDNNPSVCPTPDANDNCGLDFVNYTDSSAPGTCDGKSVITRTWSATDLCGLKSTYVQTITVVDTTPPIIKGCDGPKGSCNTTIECDQWRFCVNNSFDHPACILRKVIPDANDNCSDVTLTPTPNLSLFDICDGQVDITWIATDQCGNPSAPFNQTIFIKDTTDPTFNEQDGDLDVTIECDQMIQCETDRTLCPAPTADDNCGDTKIRPPSDDLTGLTLCNGAAGTIVRTWIVFDECDNWTTYVQTITVVDNTDPILTVPLDDKIECDACDVPLCTGFATADDNCDIDVTVRYTDVETPGSCIGESTITRTWCAEDDCGNSVCDDQIIQKNDDTPPAFNSLPPTNMNVTCDFDVPAPDYSRFELKDACDNVVVTVTRETTGGNFDECLQVTDTYEICDDCGNCIPGGFEQTITVTDNTPARMKIPADITIACPDDLPPVDISLIQASDNCGAVKVWHVEDIHSGGSCPREIQRVFQSIDRCGNPDKSIQIITIDDKEDPVVTCPDDIKVKAEAGTCTANVPVPDCTVTDNCNGVPLVCTRTDGRPLGSRFDAGTTTINCEAVDACGNVGRGSVTIEVQPVNEVFVEVCYDCEQIGEPPARPDPMRGIHFEFASSGGGTTTFCETLTFDGHCGTATFDVACREPAWDCALAQDRFHTLRELHGDLNIIGNQYVATWIDPDFLRCGNAADVGSDSNCLIDIVDFSAVLRQFGPTIIGANTVCGDRVGICADGPRNGLDCAGNSDCLGFECIHADFNGDGNVNTADFAIWRVKFPPGILTDPSLIHICEDCPFRAPFDGKGMDGSGFFSAISVEQLYEYGLKGLAVADLNNDGWIDAEDVAAFATGARMDPNSPHLLPRGIDPIRSSTEGTKE